MRTTVIPHRFAPSLFSLSMLLLLLIHFCSKPNYLLVLYPILSPDFENVILCLWRFSSYDFDLVPFQFIHKFLRERKTKTGTTKMECWKAFEMQPDFLGKLLSDLYSLEKICSLLVLVTAFVFLCFSEPLIIESDLKMTSIRPNDRV